MHFLGLAAMVIGNGGERFSAVTSLIKLHGLKVDVFTSSIN
jgi:hypothetical protein